MRGDGELSNGLLPESEKVYPLKFFGRSLSSSNLLTNLLAYWAQCLHSQGYGRRRDMFKGPN